MIRTTIVVMLLAGCSEPSPRPARGAGAPVTTEAAPAPPPAMIDAAPAAIVHGDTVACAADEEHCCDAQGQIVRPGGCQPSYPDDVVPATARGDDGRCVRIECYKKCLPEGARIATPRGEVPVRDLVAGDEVWTVDARGERVAAPVAVVRAVPLDGAHAVVELTLADGRVVRASWGHPDVAGRELGTLTVGDVLDGAAVTRVRHVPYAGGATWDLRPEGATGAYWADGVLVGTTLE